MVNTPTQDQLRTLCNGIRQRLANCQQHLTRLEADKENTVRNIISLQGTLAALQVALGDKYDPQAVPFDLTLEAPCLSENSMLSVEK